MLLSCHYWNRNTSA